MKDNGSTAAEAYARHLRHVEAMLGWIADELFQHRHRQQASPGDWGFVRDLAELEPLVRRALVRVSGMSEGEVDESLRELEA